MWWRFAKAVKSGEHRIAPVTWLVAAGAVVYTLWPLDLIADFLLPFGFADDLGVWAMLLMLVTREKQRYEARINSPVVDAENFRVD